MKEKGIRVRRMISPGFESEEKTTYEAGEWYALALNLQRRLHTKQANDKPWLSIWREDYNYLRKRYCQQVGRFATLITARFAIRWHCTIDLKELPSRYKLEWCQIHVKFEGGRLSSECVLSCKAHGVYTARHYWVGGLQAPQALQRSNSQDKLDRSTVSNACRVWGERLPSGCVDLCVIVDVTGAVSHCRWRPVSRVIVDLCVTSSLTCESSREPLYGVLPIWIGKMTNWCSKLENWTEICRHLLEITKRLLLFPSICNCLSAELTTMLSKLRIEKYSSAWTGSWQWENDDMWLKAVNLLFWTALFWGAIPSNCQGYCFETQGAVRTRSKSWISGEQESFQRRVLFLDSCYVLTAIDTGTRYDEHEFHSGSLILSTHWFGSRCDAAVQVEFSFECIPGICGWTSAWVQNGRPNHLTNSKCIRGDGRRCESKMDGRTIWRTWVSFERLILSPHWFGSCCDAAVQVEFFLFFDCVWGGLRRRESKMDGRTIRILYGWMQHESEASWHVWCVCVERWT